MANTKSAAKRARQTPRRTAINRRVKNKLKSALKKVRELIKIADKEKAPAALRKASSVLDKAAKTGQIHRNKVARHKSRLTRAVTALK
ncbi:MAG: 30S ribosomal protein S20 [Chthoniobacteraceae bacterium]